MSEQKTAPAQGVPSGGPVPRRGNIVSRLFAAIGLFLGQVLDEMRKVVRPSRQELTTYTAVVIVFVSAVMMFVFGLDYVFTQFVFWLFAGSS